MGPSPRGSLQCNHSNELAGLRPTDGLFEPWRASCLRRATGGSMRALLAGPDREENLPLRFLLTLILSVGVLLPVAACNSKDTLPKTRDAGADQVAQFGGAGTG